MNVSLRGFVLDHFANMSDFAHAIGWDRKKASDIANGRRRPSADEMESIADLLGIQDNETFIRLFFSSRVHKVD